MSMGEWDFIRWIQQRTTAHPSVIVGPGDDAAVLAPSANPLIATNDVLTEGIDFIVEQTTLRQIGRKAMAVNLSDIAAMAAVPTAALVGIVAPKLQMLEPDAMQELFRGLHDIAHLYEVPIVGGDTNSWDGGWVISVTVLGQATERGAVLRSGAKPGDRIFVTGPLGGSILARHLTPIPRVKEALRLHQVVNLHAMADISDGLSLDLSHILDASGCGAILDAGAIPIHADAHKLAEQSGRAPLDHALSDGEDFELVFTVNPDDAERLLQSNPVPNLTLTMIGECVEAGLWLREAGKESPLVPRGWTHSETK